MNNQTDDNIKAEIEELAGEVAGSSTARRRTLKFSALPGMMIFLWGWFFISLAVLVLVGWSYLQEQVYASGVQTGSESAAAQIYTDMINKAANDQCNTIFVQYDNRRVDLINVRCLQILAQQQNSAAPAQQTEENKAAEESKAGKKDK